MTRRAAPSRGKGRARPAAAAPPTVSLVSLGCPKNLVDSEKLLGTLATAGFVPTDPDGDADVLIVNTCSFIGPAQEESEEAIRRAIRAKRRGRLKGLVVAGCHAQRFGAALSERFPDVDAIVGVSASADIVAAARAALSRARERETWIRLHPPTGIAVTDDARLRLTPRHWAYLRISEGCDHACTFCAIPSFRGRHRSKPFERILAEARELAASGASEILVIGEDTTAYGLDLYGARRLGDVLRAIAAIPGVVWVRLMYAYPTGFDACALSAIAETPAVAKYVDIPFQHTATRVLKRMNRRETREDIFRTVALLRERVPGIAIRSTFIAGFPGETEEDHAALLADLAALSLDRVGCFAYSPAGSPVANRLPGAVPDGERARRRDAVMALQQRISWEKNRARIGEVCEAVVDEPHPRVPDAWIGRSQGEAPEIDGVIEIRSPRPLSPGARLRVRITHAGPYDLAGSALAP